MPAVFRTFTGSTGYACDWMPYRYSNAAFRTLELSVPEDWAVVAGTLVSKANDSARFAEVTANGRATWLPGNNGNDCEILARFNLAPGFYVSPKISVAGNYEAQIDTTAGNVTLVAGGTVASAALPASVWTSSSAFGDCWVRFHIQAQDTWIGAKVWSVNEAEPASYTVTWGTTSFTPAIGTTDAPSWGNIAGGTTKSACQWFSYGVGSPAPTPRAATLPTYYDTWFAQAATGASRVLTAEIYLPGQATGVTTQYTTAVWRLATQAYDGGPAWPYLNQPFADALVAPPTFTRRLSDDLLGRQSLSVGDLLVSNPLDASTGKGLRDDWLRAKLQRAIVALRYGSPTWPWYDHKTMLIGQVLDVSEAAPNIRLTLGDLASRYDKAVHRSTLTIGPNAGKPTPIVAGSVFNVAAPIIDAANQIYKLGEANINAVTAVRDKGVLLTDVTAANVVAFDATADTLTTDVPHGRTVGWPVKFSGTLPSPLVAGTVYYVKTAPTSTTLTLAATPGGATIDLTGGGTATIEAAFPTADLLRTTAAHGFAAADAVQFSGSVPAGITAGTTYYVLASGLGSQTLKVSTTVGGSAVNITATTLSVSSVVAALDYEVLSAAHGWALDQAFVTEGTHPAPIATQTLYFRGTDPGGANYLRFRATAGGADIDITGATTGGTVALAQGGATVTRVLAAPMVAPAWVLDASAATVQLGQSPAGQVTFDYQGQKVASVYSVYASHAVKVLTGRSDPLVSTQLGSGSGFDNFNLAVGVYVDSETNLADLLDLLARSCGSVWGCNRLGTLTATALFTGGSPTSTLTEDALTEPLRLVRKYLPVDYYEGVRVAYGRNYTVQKDADLAGSVNTAGRALYGAQWSYSINNQGGSGNLSGLDLGEKGERRKRPVIETALAAGSVTNANVLRDNGWISSPKQQAVFEVTANWKASDQFLIARAVSIKTGRFGWSAGKSFLCIGTEESLQDHTVKLTLLTDLDGYYPVTT
jgi:hypothetical protein